MESEIGISRAELFQLLQDHYERRERPILIDSTVLASVKTGAAPHTQKSQTETQDTDARYFERLYTWLKKHMNMYDKERKGYLPLKTATELLQMHPNALYHLRFQIEPFIKRLDQANRDYSSKAQAAAI
ncbi:hypothetical protein P43SY_005024 [Pythium insidiosum]|uniref:Uncharacterized protein n=1 Tax=Pythium insidiosum TaxID=114742 RepID=A0AAD5Q896_PYTIN|nr:hypothetical protein P43SY_005024 [Pythium insidiosum]